MPAIVIPAPINSNHVAPVAAGGTGASTAANARTNLDVYSKSEVTSAIAQSTAPMQITLTNLHSSISDFTHVSAYKIGNYVDINGYFTINTDLPNSTSLFNSPYKPKWLHVGYLDKSTSVGAFYPIFCSDATGNVVTNCGNLPAGTYDINIHFICK